MDGNAGIRGESVEMTRSGFERCSKNEQPTLAIENSLFVQRFPKDSGFHQHTIPRASLLQCPEDTSAVSRRISRSM